MAPAKQARATNGRTQASGLEQVDEPLDLLEVFRLEEDELLALAGSWTSSKMVMPRASSFA